MTFALYLLHIVKQRRLTMNQETNEYLQQISRSLADLECDRRNRIEFDTDTYNLISWLGESLDNIAKTLEKIEAKMK